MRSVESTATQLLATFYIRDAHCALDAAGVQEVIRMGTLTRVRNAPEEVLGVVNLRGRIVTILDAGRNLGFARAVPGPDSRVFILEDRGEFVGLLVDRVAEVVEVERNTMEPLPANVSQAHGRFFQGVYRSTRQVIAVLDPAQMLGAASQ